MKKQINSFNILIFLKGMLMGVSDLIPGISGGTIAFITGIYDRLMIAISNLFSKKSFEVLLLLLKFEFKKSFEKAKTLDLFFLVQLFFGIFFSIIVFSKVILYLYNSYLSYVLSFFLGLILASLSFLKKELPSKKDFYFHVLLSISIFIGIGISLLSSLSVSNPSFMYVIFSGFIAISALFLPGISGSYLLLLLGVYNYILLAVTMRNLEVIGAFGIGAILGAIFISKIISYLLKNFRSNTFTILFGLVIGTSYLFVKTIVFDVFAILFLLLGYLVVYLMEDISILSKIITKKKKN